MILKNMLNLSKVLLVDFCTQNIKITRKHLIMINVFAPNKVADRSSFFKNISDIIPMSNSLMILGDFNNTLSEIDRCGKTVHTYDKGYNALFEFMNKHSVDDTWRNKNN